MNFPDEDIEGIVNGIWEGTLTLFGLGKSKPIIKLYNAIAHHFSKAVDSGFSKVDIKFNEPDIAMLRQLKRNGYLFSGAKTFQYVLSTKSIMLDDNYRLIPKKEFFQKAKDDFNLTNKTHLNTEYETAIARAQSARQELFMYKNRRILPYATWVTSHSERVCPICGAMNGTTLPVDDIFWNTHPIPAHYLCMCIKPAVRDGWPTPKRDLELLPKFDEGFRTSPLSGQLFDKSHPYYDVPKKYIKLAKKNFNLPLPDEFKKTKNRTSILV